MHRTSLGVDQHLEHILDIGRVGWKKCRLAGGNVVEINHASRQVAAQFIDARDKGFEMVSIFDAGVFSDLFETLPFKADQVHS